MTLTLENSYTREKNTNLELLVKHVSKQGKNEQRQTNWFQMKKKTSSVQF